MNQRIRFPFEPSFPQKIFSPGASTGREATIQEVISSFRCTHVCGSEARMPAALEHTYRYAVPSALSPHARGADVQLGTSGGAAEYPYFFQGSLTRPRLTAQLLRVLSRVVASRFHLPAAMLERIIRERDPVVTSGGGLLRFEGFSACCSTYARVDLGPDAYEGVVVGQGTTNVDFRPEFRAALAQVRDRERVGFAVGADEVALLRGAEQIVERKVKLPLRWLKGFTEVQACQARLELRAELGRVETVRFFRSLPRATQAKTAFWIVPAGSGLRVSQRAASDGVAVAGLERLRVIEELAPAADRLRVYADPQGGSSEWVLQCGPLHLHLTLSPEVWRGFSGEGQVLTDLAAKQGEALVPRARAALQWQAELHADDFARRWQASPAAVRHALAALGSRGLVGYDRVREAYFHRELPFDLALVEEMHPRLRAARALVAAGGITVLRRAADGVEAEVPGSDVVHRVRLAAGGDRCTCPWHAKHQGTRGPCKHILAVQIATEEDDADVA